MYVNKYIHVGQNERMELKEIKFTYLLKGRSR
jgi:hypothetical protein